MGGAGRVTALDPLRVLPAERREWHDARVQPDVADLGHAPDRFAAGLAADDDAVDPGTVELLELLEPLERALLELRLRADHVQLPARAGVERQRKSVVAPP